MWLKTSRLTRPPKVWFGFFGGFFCARVVVCSFPSPVCARVPLHIDPLSSTLSLLRGAEQMGMHKVVKPQFGGGMRRFSCEEDNIYENVESELCFFTSQVNAHFQFRYTSSEEDAPIVRVFMFSGASEHSKVLAGQSESQTGGGASQHPLPGRAANQYVLKIPLTRLCLSRKWASLLGQTAKGPQSWSSQIIMFSSVPELVARGVIHQMFPLHEQRILNQLMTSWVQAVCERQPLGGRKTANRTSYSPCL